MLYKRLLSPGCFLFILLIILLNSSGFLFAERITEIMLKGSDLYRNGEFGKAIEAYEQIIDEGYEGTSLFFNLGNCYYRTGKIGYAILNYERALEISPSDEDVKHNLAFANLSTIDRIQPLPEFFLFEIWESILSTFSVNGWIYLTYFFYIALLLLLIAYFFVKTIYQQKLVLFSGLSVLLILALTISLLFVKINREETLVHGVIVEQAVTVKNSPDQKSSDAFVIHEGLKVNIEDKLDEWIKIKLADGKIGWIENTSVEKI